MKSDSLYSFCLHSRLGICKYICGNDFINSPNTHTDTHTYSYTQPHINPSSASDRLLGWLWKLFQWKLVRRMKNIWSYSGDTRLIYHVRHAGVGLFFASSLLSARTRGWKEKKNKRTTSPSQFTKSVFLIYLFVLFFIFIKFKLFPVSSGWVLPRSRMCSWCTSAMFSIAYFNFVNVLRNRQSIFNTTVAISGSYVLRTVILLCNVQCTRSYITWQVNRLN